MNSNTPEVSLVAALITAMAEVGPEHTFREGILYAPFMDLGLESFSVALESLTASGHILRHANHGVTITERGMRLAAAIESILSKGATE